MRVFQVSDGSTFEVYANSRVVFRKTPGNLKDLLDVLIGRVKVHIQKWGGQPNFNRVFTPTAVISVRGTTFDVEVEDADETTLVIVEEGLVEVQHAQHPGTPKWLNGGEWLRIYKISRWLRPGSTSSTSSRARCARWRTRCPPRSTAAHGFPRLAALKPPIGGGGGAAAGRHGHPSASSSALSLAIPVGPLAPPPPPPPPGG